MMTGQLAENRAAGLMMGWARIARIPFQTVGIMPFILGTTLAWKETGSFSLPVFALSVLAVVCIMFSTYAAGEYYDLEGDRLTARMEKNAFSGGSQAVVEGMVPPPHAKIASYLAAIAAGAIGLVLQFGFHTGLLTIPLGVMGLFLGFFYSSKPLRFVERGVGELSIGFCYGWLTTASGYYLQASLLSPLMHLMSIPIALTIFSVIMINEFPDYPADVITNKTNLVVRLGKKASSLIYAASGVATVLSFMLAIRWGAPEITWVFLPAVAFLSLYPAWSMAQGAYRDRVKLERMCAMTIVLNLLVTISYIAGLLL